MSTERWAEAVIEFKEAIKLDPLLVLAHYDLGQALMALKRYPDAVKAYLGARQAFMDLGALSELDRFKADQELEDGIFELKRNIERLRTMGGRDMNVLKAENQLRDFEELRKKGGPSRGPETPAEISLALGSAYYRTGALADAEREYLAAIKVRPGFGEAHNNLAVVCMQTGRFDEARSEIRLAEKGGFKVSPKLKDDLEKLIIEH
jgi:tetratricopeptide (TPR) repeat protein